MQAASSYPEEATAAFFCDPPWQGGAPRYKIGLSPIDRRAWLQEPASPEDHVRKQTLYASRMNDVVAIQKAAERHVEPFVALLRDHCGELGYPTPASGFGNFADAALWVPDDLCLMVRSGHQYALAAASLCAPSFWTLREKLGQPLIGLHAGHEGLNELLADRMQAVFERLPQDRVLARSNWFLHGPSQLFEPRDRTIDDPNCVEDAVIRSERQTLRRLNADCVIFTIRVRLIPFARILDFPEAAADMAQTIRNLTAAELLAFSLRHRISELLEFLDTSASNARRR